jgi:hypothetical protein
MQAVAILCPRAASRRMIDVRVMVISGGLLRA